MGFLGADIDGPMVAVRAVHFAASATTAGALLFRAVVVEPAFRSAGQIERVIDGRIGVLAWTGLAIAFASGMLWLLLQASAMSGQTLAEAIRSGAMVTVIDDTQFGLVSEIRLGLAALLAASLAFDRQRLPRRLALGAALGLVVAIAWTGHAASTPYGLGYLHLAADALHLCGAAAWTGGLISLALLMRLVGRYHASAGAALQVDAVRRFSSLGMLSVGALLMSGIINAWILVGSFHALFVTAYGRLLLLKVAAFIAMLVLAAANRFWLTPRLAKPEGEAARRLLRNNDAEIVLALLVFALVGLLGTMHPAAHLAK
jgi:putative copper resistance protein D